MTKGRPSEVEDPHAPIVRHPSPDPHSDSGMFGIPRLLTVPFEETDGAFGVWEKIVGPGQGAPLHRHPDEYETLVVIDGLVEIVCGRTVTRAGRGTVVVVPPGAPHRYEGLREASPSCLLIMLAPSRGARIIPFHARDEEGDDYSLDMLERPGKD